MKKEILIVMNTLGHAGAEMALLELIKRLDPSNYNISLYVLLAQGELADRLPNHVRLLNKRYYNMSVLSKEGHKRIKKTVLRKFFQRASGIRLLPYIIQNGAAMRKKHHVQLEKLLWRVVSDGSPRPRKQYDLAIAYLEGGASYYVAEHVRAKKKAAFIHVDYERAGYTRELDRDCYVQFDRIFTVSKEVKRHFLRIYPECRNYTEVFRNFIDQDEMIRQSMEPGGFEDDYQGIRLLTVGRLTYQKAYDIAVDAMALLMSKGIRVRWYVLGEGPQKKSLVRKIAWAGLEEDFVLLGAVHNPYPYYSQADIYVHATRFEGKSIAIQEAQTLGCIIIASDSSGNREQIENGKDGLLCELEAGKIAESIRYIIEHKELWKVFSQASRNKQMNHEEDMDKIMELL